MKFAVDPILLRQTAGPLRDAAEVARRVQINSRSILNHAEYAGHSEVSDAIDDFADAWGRALDGVASHGDSLARILDLAASAYGDAEHQAHRGVGQGEMPSS